MITILDIGYLDLMHLKALRLQTLSVLCNNRNTHQITLTRNAFILRFGVLNNSIIEIFSCFDEFTSCSFNSAFSTSSSCRVKEHYVPRSMINDLCCRKQVSALTLNSLLLILATNLYCCTASRILPLTTSHDTDSGTILAHEVASLVLAVYLIDKITVYK